MMQVSEFDGSPIEGDGNKQLIAVLVNGRKLALDFQSEHDALIFK
jgi:hypothetical protein